MKILLAGGTSPLGSDLITELQSRDHQVKVVSRNPSGTKQIGYRDVEHFNFDLIVNMVGGHKIKGNQDSLNSVLELSANLADLALKQDAILIHLSSGAVFERREIAFSADSPIVSRGFISHYQELKVSIESLHKILRARQPIADLRLFSFAGRYFLNSSDYFLAQVFRSLSGRRELLISDQEFRRDFSGPEEIADSFELVYKQRFSGLANLFSGKSIYKSEIIDYVQKEWGGRFEIEKSGNEVLNAYCALKEPILEGFRPRESIEVIDHTFKFASGS